MSYRDYTPPKGSIKGAIVTGLLIIMALAVLSVAANWMFFGASWFVKPAELFSPDAMQARSQEANDAWSGLQAQLASITTAKADASRLIEVNGEDKTKWPQGDKEKYLQMEARVSNLVTAYNVSCGKYNGMWNDEWRSINAPGDLPRHCDLIVQ